jgi:Family of unknown function (DUF6056)
MELSKKISGTNNEIFIIGILAIMVLPFLILSYYNQPTPEDFYYEELTKKIGFIDSQRVFYKFWGGRYLYYALVSVNPLLFRSITGYNISSFILTISYFTVLYLFISELTKNYLTVKQRLLFSLSIIFLFLYSLPSVAQGFYWLGSEINYRIPLILIFLFFISYIRSNETSRSKRKFFYSVVCCLLAAGIAGFNEITASIFFVSIILLLLRDIFVNKKINRLLVIVTLITAISIYISFSAPGNFNRLKEYSGAEKFISSFVDSIAFVFSQTISWTFNSPIIPITLLLTPVLFRIVNSGKSVSNIFSVSPVYSVIILFLFLFTGTFIMEWSSGISPYGRILNVLYILFLMGWSYSIILFLHYIKTKFEITSLRFPKYLSAAAYLIIFFFLIRENNITTAYADLLSGKAGKFKNDVNERYEYILRDNCDSCEISLQIHAPKSLFFMDIDENPLSVYNLGYAMYFNKKSIVLKK